MKLKCRNCQLVFSQCESGKCPRCNMSLRVVAPDDVIGGVWYRPMFWQSRLTEVPSGVVSFDTGAFKNNETLVEVDLKDSLDISEISDCCFAGCTALERVSLPKTIRRIGKGAFEGCFSLTTVTLSEGIEEIDDNAFRGCRNLKQINLPFSLKRIGKLALCCQKEYCKFKVVVLPNNIIHIEQDAFGRIDKQNSPAFWVKRDSCSEIALRRFGIEYHCYSGCSTGFISTKYEHNGVLYGYSQHQKTLKISTNIKVIAPYAFSELDYIEEVRFSDSVREIQEHAFEGCSSLRKVVFGENIVSIADKAFYDTNLCYVNLPSKIQNIASEAFDEKCVVSVDNKMPGYLSKLKRIEDEQKEISALNEKLSKLEKEVSIYKNEIDNYETLLSGSADDICKLAETKSDTLSALQSRKAEKERVVSEKENFISSVCSDLDSLNRQKRQSFIFDRSRKVLQNEIMTKREEMKCLQKEKAEIETGYNSILERLEGKLNAIDSALRDIESNQVFWKNKINSRSNRLNELMQQVTTLSEVKRQLEISLRDKKEELDNSHRLWLRKLELAKENERRSILNSEKTALLSKLSVPKRTKSSYNFVEKSTNIDEELFNGLYQAFLESIVEKNYIVEFNKYIDDHKKVIERIKEINISLSKESEYQIEPFSKHIEPEIAWPKLPERFVVINGYFSKELVWKNLKKSAPKKSCRKHSTSFSDFLGEYTDGIRLENKNVYFYLFPYCMVLFKPNKAIKVYVYKNFKVSVKYEITSQESTKPVPAGGEIVGSHYLHENLDGTPNKRYKDNPLINDIRYTHIEFVSGKNVVFSVPVKSYAAATDFLNEFNNYVSFLLKGNRKQLYAVISSFNDIDVIEEKRESLEEAERKKKLREIKAAEKERKRIQKEKLEEERAAEQRRIQIINHQREVNEERKRQALEVKAREEQIARMFDDDFINQSEDKELEVENSINDSSKLPFKILGNDVITNTVFKIELVATDIKAYGEIAVYFTDKQGNEISNRKKIHFDKVNESDKLGFVLKSGIDYTLMRKCYLKFEFRNGTIANIEYRMNIAFSPDEF